MPFSHHLFYWFIFVSQLRDNTRKIAGDCWNNVSLWISWHRLFKRLTRHCIISKKTLLFNCFYLWTQQRWKIAKLRTRHKQHISQRLKSKCLTFNTWLSSQSDCLMDICVIRVLVTVVFFPPCTGREQGQCAASEATQQYHREKPSGAVAQWGKTGLWCCHRMHSGKVPSCCCPAVCVSLSEEGIWLGNVFCARDKGCLTCIMP